jgi:hypothetical protein
MINSSVSGAISGQVSAPPRTWCWAPTAPVRVAMATASQCRVQGFGCAVCCEFWAPISTWHCGRKLYYYINLYIIYLYYLYICVCVQLCTTYVYYIHTVHVLHACTTSFCMELFININYEITLAHNLFIIFSSTVNKSARFW